MKELTEKIIPISVYETVGTQYCGFSSDGQKVYERIALAIENDRRVEVSFRGIKVLAACFLNTAIGQLYGEYSEEKISDLVSFADIESDDHALIRQVIGTAKHYFADTDRFPSKLEN